MTKGMFAKVDIQFNTVEETQRVLKELKEKFDGNFTNDEQSITADLFFECPYSTTGDVIISDIKSVLDLEVIPEIYIDVYEHIESFVIS